MRALFVVGGALAGTAAAWLLGTSSASANTDTPGVSELTSSASELTHDVLAAATGHDGPRHGSPVSVDVLTAPATSHVRDALGVVNAGLTRPAHQVLGSIGSVVSHIHPAPRALSPEPVLFGLLNPVSPHLLQAPASTVHESAGGATTDLAVRTKPVPAAPPEGQSGQAVSAASSAHVTVVHRDQRDDVPSVHGVSFPFSPRHSPLSPAGVPPMPNRAATAGHPDAPLSAVPVTVPTVPTADDLDRVRAGDQDSQAAPGSQPGVTPD